jgi:predicted nucleic acid-binding protein
VKAVDSNLLVYASLADHPASAACDQYLATESLWLTSVVNLIEVHRGLVSVYGVVENEADAKLTGFLSALTVGSLTSELTSASLPLRQAYGIDFNDAILLQTCRERSVTAMATDDVRLASACGAFGIAVENPIDAAARAQMASWEHANLPAKGLPRLLLRVHRWIEARDPNLAADLHSATQGLSRLV